MNSIRETVNNKNIWCDATKIFDVMHKETEYKINHSGPQLTVWTAAVRVCGGTFLVKTGGWRMKWRSYFCDKWAWIQATDWSTTRHDNMLQVIELLYGTRLDFKTFSIDKSWVGERWLTLPQITLFFVHLFSASFPQLFISGSFVETMLMVGLTPVGKGSHNFDAQVRNIGTRFIIHQ